MIERARKMYSATLSQAQLHNVHVSAPRAVKGVLERLNRNFNELHQVQTDSYQVYEEMPVSFLKSLQLVITTITDFLLANPTRVDGDLQAFYFEALHFSRMADAFGAHSIFDITLNDDSEIGGTALQLGHGCHADDGFPGAAGQHDHPAAALSCSARMKDFGGFALVVAQMERFTAQGF